MLDVQDAQDGTSKVSRPGRDGLRGSCRMGRCGTVTDCDLSATIQAKKGGGLIEWPVCQKPMRKSVGRHISCDIWSRSNIIEISTTDRRFKVSERGLGCQLELLITAKEIWFMEITRNNTMTGTSSFVLPYLSCSMFR